MDGFQKLSGVDPRLVVALGAGALRYENNQNDYWVRFTSGVRSLKEQRVLLASGATQTLRSYHVQGRAVDVALINLHTGEALWELPEYEELNRYVQTVADEMGLTITWGGVWKMRDGPHFQLEAI